LLDGLALSGSGQAGLIKFTALAALECFFEIIHRGLNLRRTLAIATIPSAGVRRRNA
jgi:hypothetical protein